MPASEVRPDSALFLDFPGRLPPTILRPNRGSWVMNRIARPLVFALLLATAGAASADKLLIDRTRQESQMAMPARGMTMAQVEARYGAPTGKLDPRGGQKRQWPTIN